MTEDDLPVHCPQCGAPLKEGFYDYVNADVWNLVEEHEDGNVYECNKCSFNLNLRQEGSGTDAIR